MKKRIGFLINGTGKSLLSRIKTMLFYQGALDPGTYRMDIFFLTPAGRIAPDSMLSRALSEAGVSYAELSCRLNFFQTDTDENPNLFLFKYLVKRNYHIILPYIEGPLYHGKIQGICEFFNIAFAGPGIRSATLLSDADYFKLYAEGRGISVDLSDKPNKYDFRVCCAIFKKHDDYIIEPVPGKYCALIDEIMESIESFIKKIYICFSLNGFARIMAGIRNTTLSLLDIEAMPPIYRGNGLYSMLSSQGYSEREIAMIPVQTALDAFNRADSLKSTWTMD